MIIEKAVVATVIIELAIITKRSRVPCDPRESTQEIVGRLPPMVVSVSNREKAAAARDISAGTNQKL